MQTASPEPTLAWPRLSKTDLLFVRLGGDGLGNLLFTWARCLVACEAHGWRMVWPTWSSFKPKNWRVNRHDKRRYSKLFRPPPGVIAGIRKPAEILGRKWFSEDEVAAATAHRRALVVFRGRGSYFDDFRPQHALILQRLLEMTRPRHLAGYSRAVAAPIALHVRRGDFEVCADAREIALRDNTALPIEWYIAALEAVREQLGRQVEAEVYSDGSDEQLQPLLSTPGVVRRDWGSSIADLLALARARLLIASGSTFSMWASYLGQAPTLWHPGKLQYRLLLDHPEREFEWCPDQPLPEWLATVLQETTVGSA